jgi:hypothetical protein
MKRGQSMFSWVWVVVVAFVALTVWGYLYIITDETQAIMRPQAEHIGANTANIDLLEAMLHLSPFIVLASLGLYILSTSAATGGY